VVTHTLARAVDAPSHTVLVIDDDAAIRFLCRVNLELDGWRVREAASTSEARKELHTSELAAVLLDVHLGRESGLDLLAEIRSSFGALPVVLLTGSVGSTSLVGVDADAVISKPFTLEELTGTLRKVAARTSTTAG
jgi:DNA-binding response OmpR family regulator